MGWEVEYTDEFEAWWEGLDKDEQESIAAIVRVLEIRGPSLPHPYSSSIKSSRHDHMRELRVQHKGQPYRVLYAFDPRRVAILLIGGSERLSRCFSHNSLTFPLYVAISVICRHIALTC